MLVGVLGLFALGAALLEVRWLAELGAGAAAFFAVVTFIEYLNVRRWERKR